MAQRPLPTENSRNSQGFIAMYSEISTEAITSAFQLVCYVFTAVVALLSWAFACRGWAGASLPNDERGTMHDEDITHRPSFFIPTTW